MSMALGLFGVGVSVGAVLENKRLTFARLMNRIEFLESAVDSLGTTTQEMCVSVAAHGNGKWRGIEAQPQPDPVWVDAQPFSQDLASGTLVDVDYSDSEITQNIPKVEV